MHAAIMRAARRPLRLALLFMSVAVASLMLAQETRAEAIGSVTNVRSTAYGTPPQAPRGPKHVNDPLVFKETLETLSFSALEANLNDGSVVTLGASAKVVLDEFVYDPGSGASGLLLNLGEGSLRFVTGTMPKESFQLETPTATLAIRGTNFRTKVRPNGDTLVSVDEGVVLVTVKSTGQTVEVREGQSVEIKRSTDPQTNRASTDGIFNLRNLFQAGGQGDETQETTPRPGITIDGRIYYDRIDFNPESAVDIGNPIVDLGWQRASLTGAGDKYVVETIPLPNVKSTGDRPEPAGLSEGQYGGDGCECGF